MTNDINGATLPRCCSNSCCHDGSTGTPRDSRSNHVFSHGRCVEDIELGSRIVFGKQGTEHDPAPIPYREPDMPRKLRFGFYLSGAWLPPSRCLIPFLPSPPSPTEFQPTPSVLPESHLRVPCMACLHSKALMSRLMPPTMNLAGFRHGATFSPVILVCLRR